MSRAIVFFCAAVSAWGVALGNGSALAADYSYSNTTSQSVPIWSCAFNNYTVKQFTVTEPFIVEDLNVGIVASVLTRSDLHLEIISPSNTTVVLGDFIGGLFVGNYNVRFDDSASSSILGFGSHNSSVTWPQFTLRPQYALSPFTGQNAQGTWTIRMCTSSIVFSASFTKAYLEFTAKRDYSDGPVAGYGGANHIIYTTMRLGSVVTPESSDYNSAGAAADSDDGVAIPSLVQGMPGKFTVSVAGTGGYLQAWVDWNANGSFADSGEQIATNVQDGGLLDGDLLLNGTIELPVTVPTGASTSTTYARFRWSPSLSVASSGGATGGEVEDYPVNVIAGAPSLSVTGSASPSTNVGSGQSVQFSYVISNTGNQTIRNINMSELNTGFGSAPVAGALALLHDIGTLGDSIDLNPLDGIWSELGPGDSIVYSSQYQVVQSDVDLLQ